MKRYILLFLILGKFGISLAQSPVRTSAYNTIGWYMYFGDHKISKKWSIHTEYQWRRDELIVHWQQSLARVGINYQFHEQIILTLGYAMIETFPYGEIPIASLGYAFPEHRIYEQVLIKNNIGRFNLSHRYRLEQRWLGQLTAGQGRTITGWRDVHRLRYQFRVALALKGNTIDPKEFYLAMYDEIFVGFGSKIKQNVFDQNRLYGALGYKVSKPMSIELGYLNQIVQHGNTYNSTNVFEYNNGLQVAITYNLDFTPKPIE